MANKFEFEFEYRHSTKYGKIPV